MRLRSHQRSAMSRSRCAARRLAARWVDRRWAWLLLLAVSPVASYGQAPAASQETLGAALHASAAAPAEDLAPETLPETGEFVPADPTQLPPAETQHSGCSCSACRGGAASGPPPGFAPGRSWFYDDCPKAVISEGWCRRPFYVEAFAGALSGDEFIDGQIAQQTSFVGGFRLGWDFDEQWGVEGRAGWSEVEISNISGPPLDRTADLVFWDVSLVHYFSTDLRIRPFFTIGVGAIDWEYVGVDGLLADEKIVGVPIGIGVKQRYDDWLVFRLDMTDNIAFGGGSGLGTQHNFSITGSVELRFGGPRTSYWPWQPRKYYSW